MDRNCWKAAVYKCGVRSNCSFAFYFPPPATPRHEMAYLTADNNRTKRGKGELLSGFNERWMVQANPQLHVGYKLVTLRLGALIVINYVHKSSNVNIINSIYVAAPRHNATVDYRLPKDIKRPRLTCTAPAFVSPFY
ncbi:hypothetical protein J6590_060737 [Homalodisca vitripennis]|nr:hypothetical protein J6590_060737 [Homalodisca vitripennis]